jgi:hypothetical protein
MKTNKWQKTVISWRGHNGNWHTNIPVDDLEGAGTHCISDMVAVSVSSESDEVCRVAVLTFNVRRACIGPTTRKQEIIDKIKGVLGPEMSLYVRVSTDGYSMFKVSFNLKFSFCEDVLDFMENFFKVFGIHDPTRHRLSDFEIETVSMHRHGEGWIPFTQHFKISHGFRVGELAVEMMPNTKPLS